MSYQGAEIGRQASLRTAWFLTMRVSIPDHTKALSGKSDFAGLVDRFNITLPR